MERESDVPRRGLEWWQMHGVIGGVVGGVAFAAYALAYAALRGGAHALLSPLRVIGAIVLGQGALNVHASGATSVVVGGVVHLVFSALFGAIFALLAWMASPLAESTLSLVVSATVYGFLVWAVNMHVIAPWAGWGWLAVRSEPWVQPLAHTFAFGTVLGLYLDRALDLSRPTSGRGAMPQPVEPLRRAV